jgi:hypothetical protein
MSAATDRPSEVSVEYDPFSELKIIKVRLGDIWVVYHASRYVDEEGIRALVDVARRRLIAQRTQIDAVIAKLTENLPSI